MFNQEYRSMLIHFVSSASQWCKLLLFQLPQRGAKITRTC